MCSKELHESPLRYAGGRIRTDDLLGMNQVSYHCSTPVFKEGNRLRGAFSTPMYEVTPQITFLIV